MSIYRLNAAGKQAVVQLLQKVVTGYYNLVTETLEKPENKVLADEINISDIKVHLTRNADAYKMSSGVPIDNLSNIKLARSADGTGFSCANNEELLYTRLYFATPNGSITDYTPAKKRLCQIDSGRASGTPWYALTKNSLNYSYITTAGLATICFEPETPAYGFQANLTLDLRLSAAEVEPILP